MRSVRTDETVQVQGVVEMKTPVILLCLILAGCGATSGEAVDAAIKACEPNGGVASLRATRFDFDFEVVCKNGLTIEGRVKE